ncbi:hypothetical protein GGR51DRAFT_569554 [Nemania sp. FL0031]|nr:hypothetical protein GGR51DRAFT_569554 [Nemania sp. FL0031]
MSSDDIAIVGMAFEVPQADDEDSFWLALEQKRNMMTEWPSSRMNLDTFYSSSSTLGNKLYSRGAHFLNRDPAGFDAPFFSITAKEAIAMDPQQRHLLEVSYHAFENAGIPLTRLKGSRTAVFGASMSDDYAKMQAKDPDSAPQMAGTGSAYSIQPNRISWYFDLHGPSVHIDSACSSGLVALDLACQCLKTGGASAALVTGVNLLLGPDTSLLLSNQKFLSPDSVCHSFDIRANGYARGEGSAALVLKPVSLAIRDSDIIRAVIRSTGTNQDGRTPGLTQPSIESQEALIREVYSKANISPAHTRYIEAHGTGTAIGDPIEVTAIRNVFSSFRNIQDPLYVGSVKSNIGHLEACSGLASIIKSVMMLERGVILPSAIVERLNPAVAQESDIIRIPTESVAWPEEGLRRISINSFGFGGTNAHVILDDAFHYLLGRKLPTHAIRKISSLPAERNSFEYSALFADTAIEERPLHVPPLQLLVWSALDEKALGRMISAYQKFYADEFQELSEVSLKIRRLSYTLGERRSHMAWRSFSVVGTGPSDAREPFRAFRATRTSPEPHISLVFTGQGAQYLRMGSELVQYRIFRNVLEQADSVYRSLGCRWTLFDKLCDCEDINLPIYSQPLCTALQLALFELLLSFGIRPKFVLGHSSGEIAAAYACGALSLTSACKIAYFRGEVAGKLQAAVKSRNPGAMISVNLAPSDVEAYLAKPECQSLKDAIHIACYNSPLNCTLAGPEEFIDILGDSFKVDNIFCQKLSTGVAYHSPVMQTAASEYLTLMDSLDSGSPSGLESCCMISSVTGEYTTTSQLREAKYWVDNLVSPVKFSDTMKTFLNSQLCSASGAVVDLIEIGPHSTLRRSVIENTAGSTNIRYSHVLHRAKRPLQTTLDLVGSLFCFGHPVSISVANHHAPSDSSALPLVNCPRYPFDHSQKFWCEPRLSRDYRLRGGVAEDLLGCRFQDWNPLEPRWRNFFDIESLPWVGDHVVSETAVLPAAGMIVIALEAVKQTSPRPEEIQGFDIQQIDFTSPLVVGESFMDRAEVMVHLSFLRRPYEKDVSWFQVKIHSYSKDEWRECCHAIIRIQYHEDSHLDRSWQTQLPSNSRSCQALESVSFSCTIPISSGDFYDYWATHGVKYGTSFRLLEDIKWDRKIFAKAKIEVPMTHRRTTSIVHPAVLDAALQVLLIQASQGLSATTMTCVPRRLKNAWISAAGWKDNSSLHTLTKATQRVGKRGLNGTLQVLSNDGSLLCDFNEIFVAAIAHDAPDTSLDQKLLYSVQWEPQLSMLKATQLSQTFSHLAPAPKNEESMRGFRTELDNHLVKIICSVYQMMREEGFTKVPVGLRKYTQWMGSHNQECHGIGEVVDINIDVEFQLVEELIDRFKPEWQLISVAARNMKSILEGKVDPMSLIFDDHMAQPFYDDFFKTLTDSRLRYLLHLLSHENSPVRIIEVGAGTGAWTKMILAILREMEESTGTHKFSHYTYTDISPAFFENARESLASDVSRIEFKALDLEKDVTQQGFDLHSYDLVLAGSVFHATSNLSATLKNVKQLLKPRGTLLAAELIKPDDIPLNMVFGLLPGWWLFDDKWRDDFPLVDEQKWHEILEDAGFSGVELSFKDYEDSVCHSSTIIMSRAREEQQDLPSIKIILVLNAQSGHQKELATILESEFFNTGIYEVQKIPFDHIQEFDLTGEEIVVSLVELDGALFNDPSRDVFFSVQRFLKTTKKLLWISSSRREETNYPFQQLLKGIFRCMRIESIEKQIVQCELQTCQFHSCYCASFIFQIFRESFELQNPELEYRIENGIVRTGRLIEEVSLNGKMNEISYPQARKERWATGQPLKLVLGTPGIVDTLHFIHDNSLAETLHSNQVEIKTTEWGLNFKDIFVALGRLEDDQLGCECAGVITRVGESCESDWHPGDRVCFLSSGCFRTYFQTSCAALTKLPETVSCETAVSALCPGVTAYHSLVNVAQLRKGEKVLIHSGAGATGQMAIQIAHMIGAEVFATVGYNEKKQLLMEEFGIAEDHIFYSRNSAFLTGIKHVTQGYGIDVVLNSLSGDALRASWDCVAPYGRFIEIGKADIIANTSIPMGNFQNNVSYCAVDIDHLLKTKRSLATKLQNEVVELIRNGTLRPPEPLNVFSAEEIESAFRYVQSGTNTGRTIIRPNDSDMVIKYTKQQSTWAFDEDASYLVAGGLGGLGRSILLWMSQKGAKHLIVPSRSGVSSQAASDVIDTLRLRGVHIETPICDVSSMESLSGVMRGLSVDFPPVKGCINASLVLQDALFEDMTYEKWDSTVRSKAYTSWNLHHFFPELDFFIQLSSLAGIVGPVAQSNYAAGCTFQDALARHRISLGKKAVSLDIGWMIDVGIIAENESYQRYRQSADDMQQVRESDFLAVLEIYCDPALPILPPEKSELLIGVMTPAHRLSKGLTPTRAMEQPLYRGFLQLPSDPTPSECKKEVNFALLFKNTESVERRGDIVVKALTARLARALSIPEDHVIPSQSFLECGVDSLMAVELRNWIDRDFQANVAVFDIMGGASIGSIGQLVANKSGCEYKK